jgi:pyruvate formate lyase activating enzyme
MSYDGSGPGAVCGIYKNIERFSMVDGDGIRSVIFMKGCHMRCEWCSSPVTWQTSPEIFVYREKCKGCRRCISACAAGALSFEDGKVIHDAVKCTGCLCCTKVCYESAIVQIGQSISAEAVAEQLLKDSMFYEESSGGVTISGGEPLLQIEFVRELTAILHAHHINVAIETTLNFPWEEIGDAVLDADTILVDIKLMDEDLHAKYTLLKNGNVLSNIARLCTAGRPPVIGFPLIPGYNDSDQNIDTMICGMTALGLKTVRIFPYHKLGVVEYDGLCMFEKADRLKKIPYCEDQRLKEIVERFSDRGVEPYLNGHRARSLEGE